MTSPKQDYAESRRMNPLLIERLVTALLVFLILLAFAAGFAVGIHLGKV